MKRAVLPAADTYFAPPERASAESIQKAHDAVQMSPLLVQMLDAVPDYALVLNEERQIVAANRHILEAFRASEQHLLGRRPGEAIGCIFSTEGPAGCGTGQHCSTCGGVLSVMGALNSNSRTEMECRLTVNPGEPVSLDLQVTATPVTVEGKELIFCVMKDISSEKRRLVLERVFFHDLVNTAGGIHGIASLLAEQREDDPARDKEYKRWMINLTENLLDEISHHRKLLAAERGDFKPLLGIVVVRDLLQEVHALYQHHTIADGRNLVLEEAEPCTIISDASILRRILGNLVKNALEATPRGGTVTISTRQSEQEITFLVQNPGVIPLDIQLQLFQRSFSTKDGEGRGIGTYSIKLFGERYLRGKVDFTSREPEGTTFTFTVPKHSVE